MKSKTSLYNFGLARSVIKRSWPLWLAYFVSVFSLPLTLVSYNASYLRQEGYFHQLFLNGAVFEHIEVMNIISFLFAPVAAMVLFGFLYNNRSCGMMASLPIKRETMFSTVYITGLVPMLIADFIAAGSAYLLFGSSPNLNSGVLLTWLSAAVMSNIAYYGFAVFCAMLTGNLFVLPAVYVVLNLTAAVVQLTFETILGELVYGFTSSGNYFLDYFSPVVAILENVHSYMTYTDDIISEETVEYGINNLWLLEVYCAAGAVLSVLALLLFRKRRMETASDTVAIPVLKPMFKYCLCFGTALVLSAVGFKLVFDDMLEGRPAAVVICALMLLGAFIGYFVAEMLIQKTFMVFKSGWRGMGICAAVIVIFCAVSETGLLGYEKYVPEVSDIDNVELHIRYSYDMLPCFAEKDDVSMVTELHRTLIGEKDYLENNAQICSTAVFTYTLKDGRTVQRLYRYPLIAQQAEQSESVTLIEKVLGTDTALNYRYPEFPDLTEDDVDVFEISYTDSEGQYHNVRTNSADAIEFYNTVVRPDGLEGKLDRNYAYTHDNSEAGMTTVWVYMCFKRPANDDETGMRFEYWSRAFTVPFEAERTINWLTEHTDVEIIPYVPYVEDYGPEIGLYSIGHAVG